jgi:phosphotriesterase-related protein
MIGRGAAGAEKTEAAPSTARGKIQTVTGAIEPEALGPCLTHEHILVDFIGADKVSPDRYDANEVFEVMLPYLERLRAAGIVSLVECTPNYLGRDPALLVRLSKASGIILLTNTGLYKEPFIPQWAKDASAEAIAAAWIDEATLGIGRERVKPGFIKIAVNPGALIPLQRKIVQAAALTSKATGLPIASHTNHATAALEALDILKETGVLASRYIVVHTESIKERDAHWAIARRGAWISYDGIRADNAREKLPLVRDALARYPDQILISQDAGWYHVGEARGGTVAPLDWLPRGFVPLLKDAGVTEDAIDLLLVRNPRRAFVIQ